VVSVGFTQFHDLHYKHVKQHNSIHFEQYFLVINLCFSPVQALYETLIRQDEMLAYIERQNSTKFLVCLLLLFCWSLLSSETGVLLCASNSLL
jgi:hypothetical protein